MKEGELDEDSQKVQTPSYMISIRDVLYNMINIISTVLCCVGVCMPSHVQPRL